MEANLKINGTDFTPYIKEDGISVSEIVRWSKEIVTMDGIPHKKEKKSKVINVQLLEDFRDIGYIPLAKVLNNRIVDVIYSDLESNEELEGKYKVNENSYTNKKSYNSETIISGSGFSLEELLWEDDDEESDG